MEKLSKCNASAMQKQSSMEYEKELDRLTEHAGNILQINDTKQKAIGLHNLLNRVKNAVPDVIADNAEAIKSISGGWRFNLYLQNVKYAGSYNPDGFSFSPNHIISFVYNHISDITEFENDTPEQIELRKKKLEEYRQTVGLSQIPTGEYESCRGIVRVKTMPDPDVIYLQSGVYRQYDEYSDDLFYCLCLNIKRDYSFTQQNFKSVCQLVCLYMAISNELQVAIDEMQLLGMEVPKTFLPDTEPDKAKPQQLLHFTQKFTADRQKQIFGGLTNGGWLFKDTIYSHFCYVFGGTAIPDNEKPLKPLQWTGTIKELHYFISKHLPKEANQWEKTVRCFEKDNKPINKNSLMTAVDKYDNPPDSSVAIDEI
jgi:hypothetical protein